MSLAEVMFLWQQAVVARANVWIQRPPQAVRWN